MALGRTIPVFPSLDAEQTKQFYGEKLGLTLLFQYEDYFGMLRDDFEIHFFPWHDRSVCECTGARVEVEDLDSLYAEYEPRGVLHPNGQLEEKPWKIREFVVVDPSGCILTFFQPPRQLLRT